MSPDPRIAALLAEAEQRWGRGALVRLGDAVDPAEVEVVPTGFPALDAALGIGGLPCGRISEIFGPEASGKQALVAHLVAQCQRAEGVAAYVDPGWRLDPEQMKVQGVDFHSLLVARPQAGLQAMEIAIRLARSGGVKLMILDLERARGQESGAWGRSRQGEHEGSPFGYSTPRPSSFALMLRRLVSAVDRNQIALVFVNGSSAQRQNPAPITHHSFGGQALRFFASVRLEMERREWIRRGRDVIGCVSLVTVAKNKLAPPLREAEVQLLFRRFPPDAPALQICQPDRAAPGVPVPLLVREMHFDGEVGGCLRMMRH